MLQAEAAMPAPETIRVCIIEDLRDVREGLSALINGTPGFKCINSYASMEAALARIDGEMPDVILTDIGLPGMSGIEGHRHSPRTLSRNLDRGADCV
jgi:DNA-binding NarL/FixJ family response regulator